MSDKENPKTKRDIYIAMSIIIALIVVIFVVIGFKSCEEKVEPPKADTIELQDVISKIKEVDDELNKMTEQIDAIKEESQSSIETISQSLKEEIDSKIKDVKPRVVYRTIKPKKPKKNVPDYKFNPENKITSNKNKFIDKAQPLVDIGELAERTEIDQPAFNIKEQNEYITRQEYDKVLKRIADQNEKLDNYRKVLKNNDEEINGQLVTNAVIKNTIRKLRKDIESVKSEITNDKNKDIDNYNWIGNHLNEIEKDLKAIDTSIKETDKDVEELYGANNMNYWEEEK